MMRGLEKASAVSMLALFAATLGATASVARPVDKASLQMTGQPLNLALQEISKRFDIQIASFSEDVSGKIAGELYGSYTLPNALSIVLKNSDLRYVRVDDRTIAVGSLERLTERYAAAGYETIGYNTAANYVENLSAYAMDMQADTSDDFQLDEVVVTATRRVSTVRDVPYNIQAISAQSLQDLGVRNMKDFLRMVPGVSFTDTGPRDGIRVFLRGLRSGDDYGLIPTTSTYVDDTLIDRPSNFRPIDLKVVDVERIEVLRGPQGTLYGGGSVGGTLRYISKKPGLSEWEGRVNALGSSTTHGGFNHELSAMFNAPIVEEKAAIRVNAGYYDNSGFIDNIKLGEDNIDWDKTFAARAVIRLKVSEKLTVDITYHHENAKYGDQSRYDEALGKYKTDLDYLGDKNDVINLANLTVTYDVGFAELASSTSYIGERLRSTEDITRFTRDWYAAALISDTSVPLPLLTGYNEVFADNSSLSQEIRLVSKTDSRFDWIAGAYLYDSKTTGGYDEYVPRPFGNQAEFEDLLGVKLNDDREWRGRYDQTYDQWAVFGELGFQVTDRWHASVGVRHYDFQRTGINIQIDQWQGGATPGRDADGFARLIAAPDEISVGELNENGEVLRFNTSYEISDNSLVYLTVAEGYRPGGFNVANSATDVPEEYKQYESDSLVSYELGGKFSLLDKQVYISSAIYYIDWNDMQTQIQLPSLFGKRGNAGKAHSKGFEIEVNIRDLLMADLDLAVSYAYTDAQLDETINGIGLDGESVPYVPKHTASFLADYIMQFDFGWTFGVNFLASYTGSSYSAFGSIMPSYYGSYDNDEYFFLDEYFLTNMSIRLEKDEWALRLFAHNILNVDGNTYRSYSRSRSSFRAPSELVNVTRPRTVGLEVTRRF